MVSENLIARAAHETPLQAPPCPLTSQRISVWLIRCCVDGLALAAVLHDVAEVVFDPIGQTLDLHGGGLPEGCEAVFHVRRHDG